MGAVLEATVDLAAIAHNVGVVHERSGAPVMAVVKADGYGHGAAAVARAALRAGAVEVGVATIAEALALREGGIAAPLLAWLHTPGADFAAAIRSGVEVVVSSPRQLAAIAAADRTLGHAATIGVKVDTALGRSGVAPDEWRATRDLLAALVAERAVTLRTAMCHLGRGDFGLIPAMTLTAEISLTKKVPEGQGISYNHTWVAPRDTTVAVLACGYADGLPRLLSNRCEVWIDGHRCPIVGRVCMDQTVVDLGPGGGAVAEGDRAVLFGTVSRGEPTALDWARAASTIDYEILTGIRGRRVRRYIGADRAGPNGRPALSTRQNRQGGQP